MRKLDLLPSFSPISAGSDCTLNMPVGLTYEAVLLAYSGITLAQMKNIEVLINGKVIQKFATGTILDQINQFYKRGTAAGVLVLWFSRPELNLVAEQRLTAIGTADVQTFSLRMDIDAGAAAPAITAYAIKSAQQPLGMITKIKNFPVTFATAGQQDIDNIPRSGARIAAVHLFKADISSVAVEVDSTKIVDSTKTVIHAFLGYCDRTPLTASATHIDFLADGDIFHALPTEKTKDLRIRPYLDTAGLVNVIVEYLDGFDGL